MCFLRYLGLLLMFRFSSLRAWTIIDPRFPVLNGVICSRMKRRWSLHNWRSASDSSSSHLGLIWDIFGTSGSVKAPTSNLGPTCGPNVRSWPGCGKHAVGRIWAKLSLFHSCKKKGKFDCPPALCSRNTTVFEKQMSHTDRSMTQTQLKLLDIPPIWHCWEKKKRNNIQTHKNFEICSLLPTTSCQNTE